MLFQLVNQPIEPLIEKLHHHTGGVVTFEGRVRSINDSKEVTSLEYEAYPELALHEGHIIVSEALDRLWVMSAAIHRKEAFEATECIINMIKSRVPIWKKEHYKNGESAWVQCDHCTHHLVETGKVNQGI